MNNRVSIHAPARGATFFLQVFSYELTCFNPRACTRRDHTRQPTLLPAPGFQSTRLHEARPYTDGERAARALVSIHAPARGATCRQIRHDHRPDVSIHAPARGATTSSSGVMLAWSSFNPRACTRRDLINVVIITAPDCFNPRACTRRDADISSSRSIDLSFNPRACTRRDLRLAQLVQAELVSIHAPARGATPPQPLERLLAAVSIHAPARGATPLNPLARPRRRSFNPRACTRRDDMRQHLRAARGGFNPRACTRRDPSRL